MNQKSLRFLFTSICALVALVMFVPAHAADITWQTPVAIAGASDVSTTGTLAYANGYSGGAVTINGVPFTAAPANSTAGVISGGQWGSYTVYCPSNAKTAGFSADYQTLLSGAFWSGASLTETLYSLKIGFTYQVQIWVADFREYPNARYVTATGGANTSAHINYLTGGSGNYIIGTFKADATSQVITIAGNDTPQINALQLRDITPPTPSVTWDTPATTVGDTDVITEGNSVFAYVFGGTADTVNGVPFTAYSTGATAVNFTWSTTGFAVGKRTPTAEFSANYLNILDGSIYNSRATALVALQGLTNGHRYKVQLWVADYREYTNARTATVTSVNTSGTLNYLTGDGTNPGSGVGSYVVGTFTAGEGPVSLTLNSNGTTQINALQVREIAPMLTLDSPANNALLSAPATISLAASVTANGNTINSVKFFNGATLLYEDTEAPYAYEWTPVAAGAYNLSATLVYNTVATSSTAPVQVSVVEPGFPIVVASAATDITTGSATLNGDVTSDGGATVTERGFVYKLGSGVTITDNTTPSDSGTGVYVLGISSLDVNAHYYFDAYATNSSGTALSGLERDFWTLANSPNAPTVVDQTESTITVALSGGDGNPNNTTYAIECARYGEALYVQADGKLGKTAAYQTAAAWGEVTVNSLYPGTYYEIRVKARNGAGSDTAFSSVASATTSEGTAGLIYWGAPLNITGDTDVASNGIRVFAYGGNTDSATTVNGVAFETPFGAKLALSNNFGSYLGSSFLKGNGNPADALSTDYKNVLHGASWVHNGAPGTVTLLNLVPGHQYEVQVWVDDSRAIPEVWNRSETLNGGANTVTLAYNTQQSSGGLGQYSIGAFTASTGTQAFTVTSPNVQLNAIQLRDVTPLTNYGFGYWNGIAGPNWDLSSTTNWCLNNAASPLLNGTFSAATTMNPHVYLADIFYADGAETTVTQSSVTIAEGGVSTETVDFLNSSVPYTLESADSFGITGDTILGKSGSGQLTLAGSNTHTGGTTLSGGTLNFNHPSAIGSGPLTITTGSLDNTSGSPIVNSQDNAMNWNGNFSFVGSSDLDLGTGNVTMNTSCSITSNSGDLAIGGMVNNGTRTLTKLGAGALTFRGNVTLNNLDIQNGEVVFDGGNYTTNNTTGGWGLWLRGTGAKLTVANGAAIDVATGLQIQSGTVEVTGGSVTVNRDVNAHLYVGNSANAAALNISGTGSVITTAMSFGSSGSPSTLNLEGGTLAWTVAPAKGTGTATLNMGGGTLRADGSFSVPGTLPFNLSATNGSLTVDSQTHTLTLDNALSGTGGLIKTGTGTVELSGTNGYDGTTLVSEGTLAVNGTLATTAITVASAATLGGTGTLGGNVIFSSEALARFTQGSPLTISGTLTLNDNVVHLVLPTGLGLGTYPLATYTATGSTGTFSITPLIDSGSLVTDAVATITMADGTVSLTVGLTFYHEWKNGIFANGGTLSDKTLGGDPDGDQHTNLEEYAFDTDPTVSSSSSIAYTSEGGISAAGQPVTSKVLGDYYAVFGRRLDYVEAGLTYTVEFSAGLDIWVANDDLSNPPVSMCSGNGTIDAMGVKFPETLNFEGNYRKPTFFRMKVESH